MAWLAIGRQPPRGLYKEWSPFPPPVWTRKEDDPLQKKMPPLHLEAFF